MYPLAALLRPQIFKFLDKDLLGKSGGVIGGGAYTPKENEEVISLAELPKEDYLAFIGRGKQIAELHLKQRRNKDASDK